MTLPMTRLVTTCLLTILVSIAPHPAHAQNAQPGELIEVSDDFPRLEVRGGLLGGRPCTEDTATVCLPDHCEVDSSRSHSTDTGRAVGPGGPGYGVFVSGINSPGGEATSSHRVDLQNKCLTSTVRVCALRRQRGWYEGRHVLYGVCQDQNSGGESPPPAPEPQPGAGEGCCGTTLVAGGGCCPPVEEEVDTCTFEVRMAEVRVSKEANLLNALDGKAELQITGYANGQTVTHPSSSTWFIHHHKWGWVPINKAVTRIEVARGARRVVEVMAEGVEADISGGGSAEHGASQTGRLNLTCDQPVESQTVTIDFHRLKTGLGDLVRSELEVGVRFQAYQVTP